MSIESHAFVALYEGQTIGQAHIIAASSDPELVSLAAKLMLHEQEARRPENPIASAMSEGRKSALQVIQDQVIVE